MPNVTYDGQSFSVEGRRVWLVSGAIHYARVPRGLWRDRIRAAKQAGLNCIETYCFWNAHESEPGVFDFEDHLDLRAFVELLAEEGMWCILRPGPFVCAEWDMGGMPAWLHRVETTKKSGPMRLRQPSGPFLEACGRYLRAVMNQVKDLQVTSVGPAGSRATGSSAGPGEAAGGYDGAGGGPILMIQVENEWFCTNQQAHDGYLREIARYLTENGARTPLINCNQLWQPVDGTIDCWNGSENLFSDLRQLRVVQPDAPRLVTEYWTGWFDQWGGEHTTNVSADLHAHRLGQILAAGAMPNLYMFHGGSTFGFFGGRTVHDPACYMTQSYDYDAPLGEAGDRGEKFAATKRLCTFASRFGGVLAHLDASAQHVAAAPVESGTDPVSVLHLPGTQGEVVFCLAGDKSKADSVKIVTRQGLTLDVPMGKEPVAWLLLETNLGGRAILNYTNLRPWAQAAGRLLAFYGPEGAQGLLAIDGTPLSITVPGGKRPEVVQHENWTVVVMNRDQVDAAYLHADGLIVGADGLDDEGQPRPLQGWSAMTLVGLDGRTHEHKPKRSRKPHAPKLESWQHAELDTMLDGSDASYGDIDGPTSLEHLGQDFGYGWYDVPLNKAGKGDTWCPRGEDRLTLYHEAKPLGVLGNGPGAEDGPTPVKLPGSGRLIVLADNLGRFNYGQRVGTDLKGMVDPLYSVTPVKLGKPEIADGPPADPFAVSELVYHQRKGDLPLGRSFTWSVKPASRRAMVLQIDAMDFPAVVLINGEPAGFFNRVFSGHRLRMVLEPTQGGFTTGTNELTLSLLGQPDDGFDIASHVSLWQTTGTHTGHKGWRFAKWTEPSDGAFVDAPARSTGLPCWWRCGFSASPDADTPLFWEPKGLSKGQVYLNGRNLGRYFVATPDGKTVGPQKRWYLPEPWLNADGNTLMIFDEAGKHPGKSVLVYDTKGTHG